MGTRSYAFVWLAFLTALVASTIVPQPSKSTSSSTTKSSSKATTKPTTKSIPRPTYYQPSPPKHTGTKYCRKTVTKTKIATSFVTITTTTQVIASNANPINGDDFPQRLGTLTITYTSATTTTITSGTTTVTTTTTPEVKIGTDVFITIPTPAGFLPVQSTLPQATYGGGAVKLLRRKQKPKPCKTVTKKKTSTTTATKTSTITNTLTGNVIIFPEESTAFEYDTFTFPTVYVPIPTTITDFRQFTATATATATTTTTVKASTVTVYEACATNNFASAIRQENGTVVPIINSDYDTIISDGISTALECCEAALGRGAATWIWAYRQICVISLDNDADTTCTPDGSFKSVRYGYQNLDVDIILGNGYCGRYTQAFPQ